MKGMLVLGHKQAVTLKKGLILQEEPYTAGVKAKLKKSFVFFLFYMFFGITCLKNILI